MLVSCKTENEKVDAGLTVEQLTKVADSIQELPVAEKLSIWQHCFSKQNSPTTNAFLHYQMAKNLAAKNLDSAKYHINKAMDLIEPEKAHMGLKMSIYNGVGNIANLDGRMYEATFYYNKAAAILVADSTLSVRPEAKIIYLLSAAQANFRLQQYAKAIQQNKLAISILNTLPKNFKNKHRAYSQLFSCYWNTNKNTDSLKQLVYKMEAVAKETNDGTIWRFTNESKSQYFHTTGQLDSAISCQIKVKNFDQQTLNTSENNLKYNYAENFYISLSNLITLCTADKKLADAAAYLKEADELEKKYPDVFSDYEKELNSSAKAQFYYASGQYAQSHAAFDSSAQLKNNMLSQASIQSMEEMSTIYQLQAKDRSIKSLGENVNTATQKLERNHLLLIISGLVALLALSLLGFFIYSQKQRKQKQEKEKVLLQQQLLRTQMEPHFIFNTLAALQSFIRFDEKEKSIKYLNQFSRLLRSSLELSRQNVVPLNEEIETLENYLSLQQMRHNHSFAYKIATLGGVDTSAIMIPPMLIQPFVENAIVHGLNLKNEKGFIEIKLAQQEQLLLVTIQDNGHGMAEDTQGNKEHKSLSGTIAKERLGILARELNLPANIEIHSEKNKGTTVLLTLPVA
jgi:anti-sigma regulatory factor (Ser/Thr protein kinase)